MTYQHPHEDFSHFKDNTFRRVDCFHNTISNSDRNDYGVDSIIVLRLKKLIATVTEIWI